MEEAATRDVVTARRRPLMPPVGRGEFRLLSIGINQYGQCPTLQTAVHGAEQVAEVLIENYGFAPQRVTLLRNEEATRGKLIRVLRDFARRLGENDSLLIFYSGHGHLDEFRLGHWIPVEASLNEAEGWISNADIKNILRVAKARHIFLVSDSCFAGDFFKEAAPGGGEISDAYVEMAFSKMSRQVLTSGGLESVSDGGVAEHSVFTYFLLKQLRESREPYLVPLDLFQRIRGGVAANARQQPQFGVLAEAGGELGGEFVLFRHGGAEAVHAALRQRRQQLSELERREQEALQAASEQAAALEAKNEELREVDERIQRLQRRLGKSGAECEALDRFVGLIEEREKEALELARMHTQAAATRRRRETELERLRWEEAVRRKADFESDWKKWERVLTSPYLPDDVKDQAWETLCRKWQVSSKMRGTLGWREGRVGFLEIENSLGMRFVPVPGTEVLFSIWQTRGQDYAAFAEATNRGGASWKNPAYKGQPVTPGPAHPVVCVGWRDAEDFCEWLTEKERRESHLSPEQRYRLPRDVERSAAVGLFEEAGATSANGDDRSVAHYPWGNRWPPPPGAGNYADLTCRLRFRSRHVIAGYRDGFATTSPVGSFKANAFGVYDLGGNVREWCEDWFGSEKKFRVLRGASWLDCFPGDLLSSNRVSARPGPETSSIGFRVVLAGDFPVIHP